MKSHFIGLERTISREPVYIPSADGESIAETLWVDVPVWRDPTTKTIFLDDEARKRLEAIKARHLGLLGPQQLKQLRQTIGLTQQDMAKLLQLGQRSWTRWETGRERPSRSMNVLLCALYDGRIDVNYLMKLSDPNFRYQFKRWLPKVRFSHVEYNEPKQHVGSPHECTTVAA